MTRLLKSLLPLLALLWLLPLQAQQKQTFTVTFGQDPRDATAQNPKHERRDGDGQRYAIVKVRSTSPDDDLSAYQFNFGYPKHIVTTHDDELWVYVQRNAKWVTVSRQGYATVSKYDLGTTIQAGYTYLMQLSPTAAPILTQMVQFSVKPAEANAVVFVQNEQGGAQEEMLGTVDKNGAIAKALPLGAYTYRVTSTDYHTSEGRLLLNKANQTHIEEIVLKPNYAQMTLRAATPETEIFVNGQPRGRGSWTGRMKAGNYQLETRLDRHKPATVALTVREQESRTVDLPAPTPITGTLALTSRPIGAHIAIDGRDYGQTPRNIDQLIIGQHQLVLSMPNYTTEQRTFDIEEQQTTSLDVVLNDIARMTIESKPTGATLYVNGQQVGKTPYTADMASGDYLLRLTYPRHRDFSGNVHLDSSNPKTTLSLTRQYVQPTCFYLSAMAQAGTLMGAGGAIGTYLYNINVEASYLTGLAKSEDIYWSSAEASLKPLQLTYKPTAVFGLRLGYGIVCGTRLRLTPQVGASVLQVKSEDAASKGSAVSATIALRAEYALAANLSLFVAPEAAFALQKSDVYTLLADVSPKVKGWGTGFNARAGLSINF